MFIFECLFFDRRHSVDRESCAPTHVRAGSSVPSVHRWFDWVTQESVVLRNVIRVLSTRAHTGRLGLCLVMLHDVPGLWLDLAPLSPAHSSLFGRPKVSTASDFPVSTEQGGALLSPPRFLCASLVVRTEVCAQAIRPPGRQDTVDGEGVSLMERGPQSEESNFDPAIHGCIIPRPFFGRTSLRMREMARFACNTSCTWTNRPTYSLAFTAIPPA